MSESESVDRLRKLLVGLAIGLGLLAHPRPAAAQLGSVPYTFTPGSVIRSAEVNTDFSTAYANALNRTGGTMTGSLTMASGTSFILQQTGGNYTLTWANPGASRALTIPDPGGSDSFAFLAASQTLTNKTLTAPTLSGTVAGTYTLGGSPTLGALVNASNVGWSDGYLSRVGANEIKLWNGTALGEFDSAEVQLLKAQSDTPGFNGSLFISNVAGNAQWGFRQAATGNTLNLDYWNGSAWAQLWTLSTSGGITVSGGVTAGSGAVGIVDSTGKIPAISSTYFASLSGANLTALNASNVSSGTLAIARGGTGVGSASANQVWYGSFSQSSNLTFDGNTLKSAVVASATPAYVWGTLAGTYGNAITAVSPDIAVIGIPGAASSKVLGIVTSAGSSIAEFYGDFQTKLYGVLTVSGFGTHTFSAGGTGGNQFQVRNTTAGTANFARVAIGNDASATTGIIQVLSSTYSTSGQDIADSLSIQGTGAGGLNLVANNASGPIRFYTGGTTLQASLSSAGVLSVNGTGTHTFAGPLSISKSVSGGVMESTFSNTSTTASSIARVTLASGSTSGGAGQVLFNFNSTTNGADITSTIVGTNGMGLIFETKPDGGSLAEHMRIFGSGGVAIGDTTDPGAGNLAVHGAVSAAVTSGVAQAWLMDGAGGSSITGASGVLRDKDLGGSGTASGRILWIGGNSNASKPAAGAVALVDLNGTPNFLWVDGSANVRVRFGTAPSNVGDTAGTVVGTQTSTRDTKNPLGGKWTPTTITPSAALDAMVSAPVFDYYYKNGAYSGTLFHFTTIDDAPWVGMDPDAAHPNGRSFNPETFAGYTMLSVRALNDRIASLEKEVAVLKARSK